MNALAQSHPDQRGSGDFPKTAVKIALSKSIISAIVGEAGGSGSYESREEPQFQQDASSNDLSLTGGFVIASGSSMKQTPQASSRGVRCRAQWVWNTNAHSLRIHTVRWRNLAGSSRRSTCCAISTTKPIAAVFVTELNRGEGRHQLARIIFHGKRGELRQRYREGQEDQLGALGLVVNAVILGGNTIDMDAALAELRAKGFDVRDEDVARLSPLGHGDLNVLGRLRLHASRVRRTRRFASVAPSWWRVV